VDPVYKGQKFLLNIEGSHTALQVYINGTLLKGVSAVAADVNATHVVGFIPVVVDLTPYIKADGATDNVIAIDVSRGNSWYEQPNFCGAFRFGQAMAGLFRNVYLYITNPVHIPLNVYSNTKTWGTYVGTVSEVMTPGVTATAASAVVNVQTNILNEGTTAQTVTLTTQIVDAQGNVVATAVTPPQTIQPMAFPTGAQPLFSQNITVPNPTLWYPNNTKCGSQEAPCGTPYMYKVYSLVSVNGNLVDSVQSPLGIRLITWDKNFPYFNGQQTYLWGASSRYDYPALGSSVPDEIWYRDLQQFATSGGNVWRPGHCTHSEEFVEAADAYGVMVDEPSGDGEGYWSNPSADDTTLKEELHRDMIIRDRSHPSILDWELDNGGMNQALATALDTVDRTWDNINPRVQADRTYNPNYAFMAECDGAGCEYGMKTTTANENNPAFGAEYWNNIGTGRGTVETIGGTVVSAYDYELAFAAPYLNDWAQGRSVNTFGMAQWYFAETPGEISNWAEFAGLPAAETANMDNMVRSLGYSMVDQNRFPRLLYYIYQANWTSFGNKPMVHLAHHWNRQYEYTQNVPIQENAFSNCPKVRLLINGAAKDPVTGVTLADETPNPWNINTSGNNAESNPGQDTTVMAGQVHWMVNWASGTVTAECIGEDGNPVAGVSDTRTTAGAENKIVLTVLPEIQKPDGTSFQWTSNGSDAALVQAEVEDASGNWVPTAMDNVTFTVSGPATYMGGTQQLVADPSWTNYYSDAFSQANSTLVGGLPYGFFHSPGDPELNFEGGLQKIALRSTFTPGTVTVTASAPGLVSSTVQLTSVAPPPPPQTQPPVIIVPPVNVATTAGYSATFTVTASGGGTLSYQWYQNGSAINGATGTSYTIAATTLAENNATFTVTVTSTYGSTTSDAVTLTVAAAANVAITTQPASETVVAGQTATMTVVASGSPTLTYQWYQNGAAISGATQASYTTPVLTAAGTQSFYVIVNNPINKPVQSSTATLTINAPTAVAITASPVSVAVALNQATELTATVSGSSPYTYQWNFTPTGGATTILASSTQTSPTITYTIPAFTSANAGAYTVTVNNAANVAATSAAANLTLAPPGVNLALDKTATSSSTQGACTDGTTTPPYTGTGCEGPENAVDGNQATRWASASAGAPPTPPVAGVDPSWLQVDLGSVQAFNTVIINWENAYATQYLIQYTSGDPTVASNWQTAFTNTAGAGGTDQESFPTVQGRYIRMLGQQRSGNYGYSIWEFQVYNVPQCGGSTERYTVSTSNPNLVTDNTSGLTWTRTITTDTAAGSQFTGLSAVTYCSGINMRVPTQSEAMAISGNSDASCAFPGVWRTWTSTVDPSDSTRTGYVSYDGTSTWQVTNNYPGETLCDSGNAPVAPAAPTNLTATAVSSSQINLAWTASTTANVTYQVFQNGAQIGTATGTTYSATGLAASTTYSFTVEATDSTGTSVAAGPASATTQAAPACSAVPTAPANFTATASSSTAIGLSWFAVAPPANCTIGSYSIYGGTTANPTTLLGTTTGTSYSNTGLAASTTYYYVVKATDADGSSAASTQVSAKTQAAPVAPAAPTSLTATAVSSSQINLLWTASTTTGATYLVFQNGVQIGTATGTTYSVTGLAASTTYSFTVKATNSAGTSAAAGPVSATTQAAACSAVPAAPTNLNATASSSTAIGLTWSAVTAPTNCTISSYSIYGGTTANPTTLLGTTTGTSYSNTNLTSSTTYYYVVKATDADGSSAASGQVSAETLAAPAPTCSAIPTAPGGLTATATSSTAIGLMWTSVTAPANCSIASYNVYSSMTSGFTPGSGNLLATVTSGTNYSNTGLAASTTYYYVVEAVDGDGNSAASTQASATTTAGNPTADFTLGISPASLTVVTGQSGTETVTVTPENGFPSNSNVTLTCSGLPSGAACNFSSATVTSAGNITSTLTVTTTKSTAGVRSNPMLWLPGSALAAVVWLFGWKKRRSMLLMLMVGVFGMALFTGCGGAASGSSNNSQPVTSTITVTATSGPLQHTATFSLIVTTGSGTVTF
jgi:hypothetical protein